MGKNCVRILIVDDEEYICEILSRLMKEEGFKTLIAHEGDKALKMVRFEMPDVMLLDLRMPGMNGMEVLKGAKKMDSTLPVIIITAHADIHGAVEAMRVGAHDYLAKPFEHVEVIRVVRRALAERRLKEKLKIMSSQLADHISLAKKMGPSDVIKRLISEVNRVATTDFTVVIQGETGAGKELVARAIHHASHRSAGPFVAIDCGAIPETLLESELFGHEKGAFTGAVLQKFGKFETANKGTLLLDEISNMPMNSQAKILRTLQEKKLYRVGSTKPMDVDTRLLVACNQKLATAVASGLFREDLFYRLNEFTIKVPSLRDRKEDIPYLAKRFLDATNMELNKSVKGFSESAIQVLFDYNWPGNVRQLRSTVRRAVLMADEIITDKHLNVTQEAAYSISSARKNKELGLGDRSFKEILRHRTQSIEREILVHALKSTGGNKAKAARLLQIDYKTIHTKVKKLEISTDGGHYG